MKYYLFFPVLLSLPCAQFAQELSGLELIERSCRYHDPDRLMTRKGLVLELEEPRKDKATRMTTLVLNPSKNVYVIRQQTDGHTVVYSFIDDKLSISLNGRNTFSESEKEKFRLTEERARLLRDYYYFLWALPCNLLNKKAQIDTGVKSVIFDGTKLLEVTVSYPGEPDSDTWRFYFDPLSYALSGYMFFNKKSDGEYILLEGEKNYKSMRLPAQRSWYDNHDEQFLATDKLLEIRKYKKP